MERYICIHGHFYQPPRENPWLESIEIQDSAYPFHDWNERITSECYGPNATARILNEQGQIESIVNNYSKMSFNFGPTLLSWMEETHPTIYQAILQADRDSLKHFGGHGSALAQVYNHIIMPLANHRDKVTQVQWGISDFVHRFGRQPEGMWLAETAVDTDTLEVLAEAGIQFTILAPHQAHQIRAIDDDTWHVVNDHTLNTQRPYLARLPSGRTITLFFYNGALSRAVAFEKLLNNGEHFAHRLSQAFSDTGGLVHIATDGETYGHHHRHGDMALAYALHYIEREQLATLTNYGAYLAQHPPQWEARIHDNTSWSCAHGVERWRSDCGCHSGGQPHWQQAWRGPLRDALDWLRDRVDHVYHEMTNTTLRDPEQARNDYIHVILDRCPEQIDAFFAQHAIVPITPERVNTWLKLLEIQRNTQLMYTSCGWFFDEISGLETTQILQYAGRVIQLMETFSSNPTHQQLEAQFRERLANAPSNLPEHKHGEGVYQAYVQQARVDFPKLAAHYAATALFHEEHKPFTRLYAYEITEHNHESLKAGHARLALGTIHVRSRLTQGSADFCYGGLHLGDHNLTVGVRLCDPTQPFLDEHSALKRAFYRVDYPDVLKQITSLFSKETYSVKSLFRDQQRQVLDCMLEDAMAETQKMAGDLYDHHAPLLRYLVSLQFPLPDALRSTLRFVIHTQLKEAFAVRPLPFSKVQALLEEAHTAGVSLNDEGLSYSFQCTLETLAEQWTTAPDQQHALDALVQASSLLADLPFDVNLYHVQTICYQQLAHPPSAMSTQWQNQLTSLAHMLQVKA